MVGHIPLEDGIGVRVPVPQLTFFIEYEVRFFCHVSWGKHMGLAHVRQGLEAHSDVSSAGETTSGGLRDL